MTLALKSICFQACLAVIVVSVENLENGCQNMRKYRNLTSNTVFRKDSRKSYILATSNFWSNIHASVSL